MRQKFSVGAEFPSDVHESAFLIQVLTRPANYTGSASKVCILCLGVWIANLFACSQIPAGSAPAETKRDLGSEQLAQLEQFSIYSTPPASPARTQTSMERPCAWFGDRRGEILYFGQAAFWSAYHEQDGDPSAVLASAGPLRVGRFDLAGESFLPALELDSASPNTARAGVWDVLAHPSGRIYFTTFFESAGYVDPENGAVRRFPAAGVGFSELTWGPGESILLSRYAASDGSAGSVVLIDLEGELLWEHKLEAPPGLRFAPKTVAFDPIGQEIWITGDLLPGSQRHPALVIDLEGRERLRVDEVELQFVRFTPDGRGYLAVVDDSQLFLLEFSARTPRELDAARSYLLDTSFPASVDFVQDISLARDGRVVVTRWSGALHLITPSTTLRTTPPTILGGATVQTTQLPRIEAQGLYYSGFAEGDRICATYCAGVTVVCGPAPGFMR